MSRIKYRGDFFKITAKDGDEGLFGEKLRAICDSLTPNEREFEHGRTHMNIDILESPEGSNLIVGKIFQSRNDNITKRKQGTVESLPIPLAADEDIDETSYFAYCPDTSLIGVAYNYHGPKIVKILYAVNKLYRENVEKNEKPNRYIIVQRGKAMDEVLAKSEIKGVTARLKDPSTGGDTNLNADAPDVFKEFKAPSETTIEVTVKSKKKGGIAMRVKDFKKKFLRKKSDLDFYDVFRVDATDEETGIMRTYDLLNDKVQEQFSVQLEEDEKSLVESDMIQQLCNVTNQVKERYDY